MPPAMLKRHPGLHTSRCSERSASWIELFFDLVYVPAVAERARYLHDHLNPGGFLGFAGLFAPVWWTWICFSFYADQFDPDDLAYRIVMLLGMLLSIVLAVTIPGASSYVHLVFYAGLTAASVGIARAIAVSPGTLEDAARISLCAGVAVALLTISLIQQLGPRRLSRSELIVRLVVVFAALLLAFAAGALDALAIVGLLMLLLILVTVFEVAKLKRDDEKEEEAVDDAATASAGSVP